MLLTLLSRSKLYTQTCSRESASSDLHGEVLADI